MILQSRGLFDASFSKLNSEVLDRSGHLQYQAIDHADQKFRNSHLDWKKRILG